LQPVINESKETKRKIPHFKHKFMSHKSYNNKKNPKTSFQTDKKSFHQIEPKNKSPPYLISNHQIFSTKISAQNLTTKFKKPSITKTEKKNFNH
jgi:hypothetical protein